MSSEVRQRRKSKSKTLPASLDAVDENIIVELQDNPSFFKKKRFWFPVGILTGILIAGAAFSPIPEHVELFFESNPLAGFAGFDMTRIESEWSSFRRSLPEPWKLNNDGREYQVGDSAAKRGLSAKYPVILIPGIISTALESWTTTPEYRSSFREKLWGGFHMVAQVTLNREKWVQALMLDPITGLDPPGIRIRAVEGIDAASSFIQGYWIWSKIIENLAALNYDTNNLHLASYDWRLSYWNLEERDGYFSRLKTQIEGFKGREKRKVVLVAHSMGATVTTYFLKWVEAEGFGNGGPSWVEDHIEAIISIGGTHLGVTKAMSAFLSGEMRDTVAMSPAGAYVLERFFSRKERAQLFRSWAGSASMWIKGGEAIWGNKSHAADDHHGHDYSHGQLLSFREEEFPEETNLTAEAANAWILSHTPISFQKMLETNYSYGIERDEAQLKKNGQDHTKWSNPLEIQLPIAPSLKIYCVYGHGKPTERSYWYARGEFENAESIADIPDAKCPNDTSVCESGDLPLVRASWIDHELTQEDAKPTIRNGVKIGEGDGTVSLISLGGMCVEGWKRKRWNPGGVKIITHEFPHQPTLSEPRGGANTSDHIDILGSTGLNEIVVKVATGNGDEIEERLVSPIREYAAKMGWD